MFYNYFVTHKIPDTRPRDFAPKENATNSLVAYTASTMPYLVIKAKPIYLFPVFGAVH